MNAMPQSPLSRVVARTPMQPVSFTLLREQLWVDGVMVFHREELPEDLKPRMVQWYTTLHGRRMPR